MTFTKQQSLAKPNSDLQGFVLVEEKYGPGLAGRQAGRRWVVRQCIITCVHILYIQGLTDQPLIVTRMFTTYTEYTDDK